MNITITLDSQEELQMLLRALKDLPFLDKIKMTVAAPNDLIPSQVKSRVLEVLPEAELLLFGSRARGDASKHSDWDFMVVTPQKPSKEAKNRIFEQVMALELAQSIEIQLLYRTKAEFSAAAALTGVVRNAATEGIDI